MAKIKKYGFYRVCESINRIMPGVNALLDANTIVAMMQVGPGIISVQCLALDRLFTSKCLILYYLQSKTTLCHIHLPCNLKMDVSKLH